MPNLPSSNRKPACFFADLPGAGPCDGRLVRCHLIPRQQITRAMPGQHYFPTPQAFDKAIEDWHNDPRGWVWGCGGIMGNAGHHGQLDASRTLRVPRYRLPAAVEEFAEELGLGWWLDREYGPRTDMAVPVNRSQVEPVWQVRAQVATPREEER